MSFTLIAIIFLPVIVIVLAAIVIGIIYLVRRARGADTDTE